MTEVDPACCWYAPLGRSQGDKKHIWSVKLDNVFVILETQYFTQSCQILRWNPARCVVCWSDFYFLLDLRGFWDGSRFLFENLRDDDDTATKLLHWLKLYVCSCSVDRLTKAQTGTWSSVLGHDSTDACFSCRGFNLTRSIWCDHFNMEAPQPLFWKLLENKREDTSVQPNTEVSQE